MPRWTSWRTFAPRTITLEKTQSYGGQPAFYTITALAIDSSVSGSNHLPNISGFPDSVNDQPNYHRYRNVHSNLGYYIYEAPGNDGSSPLALVNNNNPSIPFYYDEEYNGLLPAVEQHRLVADIFDFTYYAEASLWPDDDPDASEAIDIEWKDEGQYIDGEYSLVPCTEANGGRYTPDDFYPTSSDPSVIPQFDWHLYRLPESLYEGKRLNEQSPNIYKTVTFEENITSVLNSLTPINTWPSASMADDHYVVDTDVYHHERPRYYVPVPTLEANTKTAVFAVVDSPYLGGGIPVPPEWSSYQSMFSGGTNINPTSYPEFFGPGGLTPNYDVPSKFTFTWIPRPYRLQLPGIPPMRQRHRDDGLTTDTQQQRGHGSSRQSSIRQGGRVYY